jgi:hypothetical protein
MFRPWFVLQHIGRAAAYRARPVYSIQQRLRGESDPGQVMSAYLITELDDVPLRADRQLLVGVFDSNCKPLAWNDDAEEPVFRPSYFITGRSWIALPAMDCPDIILHTRG